MKGYPEAAVSEARLEEAADWFLRLNDRAADEALRQEFDEWLAQNPQNRLAWEKACGSWRVLGLAVPIHEDQWPGTGSATNRPGIEAPPATRPSRRIWQMAAAVLAVLVLVAISGRSMPLWDPSDYRTRTAETRTIQLADGSVISLGARSAVEIDMSGAERRVQLLSGEVFFDVAPDPQRPFIVSTRDVSARVLGTAFNVQLSADTTQIALEHGSLHVSAGGDATLAPGDSVTVSHDTGQIQLGHVAPDQIASWRDGKIFVDDMPISAVVEQIRRYHPGWIRLSDGHLGRQRVTGLYDLSDPDKALQALVRPFGGQVRKISPWLVLLSAGQPK
ncbi:FecR family protein [Paracoccus xiamenensis]|uniref:FecR family protein n=1 Tax=Paracoccus xiamenensis TaxID=2714901 RepID=UPI00140A4AF2|nr:FecR family protein [Paracoccus xiamenensis]NHF74742.1 FecR family protein [Paracoccus xiamenensis]